MSTDETTTQDEAATDETSSAAANSYPLAYDANGEPLDVPPTAVAWRVRKLARKAGRPKLIFDAETGRALELPIAIGFDDFAEHVAQSGRYRLEAIDAQGRAISGCVAVTEVVFDDEEVASGAAQKQDAPQLIQLVAQLVDTNARVMQAMASAFGQVRPMPPTTIVRSLPLTDDRGASPSIVSTLAEAIGLLKSLSVSVPPSAAPAASAASGNS